MKLLYVVPIYEPAMEKGLGIPRGPSQFCRGLVKVGVDVTVFTTDCGIRGIPLNQEVDVGGVKTYYFRSFLKDGYRYSSQLRNACKEIGRASCRERV